MTVEAWNNAMHAMRSDSEACDVPCIQKRPMDGFLCPANELTSGRPHVEQALPRLPHLQRAHETKLPFLHLSSSTRPVTD